MKKINWILVLICLMAACKNNEKAKVVGTIKNMGNGEIFFIKSDSQNKIDTIKVTNDKFTYETTVLEPTVFMVNFGANQQPAFIILENGTTTIDYDLNVVTSLKVKGGKEQELYNSFLAECNPYFSRMDSLGVIADSNANNQEVMMALQKEFYGIDQQVKAKQREFVQKNPKSIVSAFLGVNFLTQNPNKTFDEVMGVYNSLDKTVQTSYYGKKIQELADQLRSTSVGQMAPNFTLPDMNDQQVSLASFKGKIVLVDFWASWCGPCRNENPNVVMAYNKYHDKGFDVLGVSLDDNKSNWSDAVKKDNLSWTHVSDLKGWQSDAAMLYGIQSIPSNYLLDKEGKIIAKDLRGEALEQKLNELFPQ